MTSGWTIAFRLLWLAPIPLALAWGLTRLALEDRRLPAWPASLAAVLALAPVTGGVLLTFAQLVDPLSPLAAPGALALLGLLGLVVLGATWALTTPTGRTLSTGVLGLVTLLVLFGLLLGRGSVGTRVEPVVLVGLIGLPFVILGVTAPVATHRWWTTREDRVRWAAPAALGVLLVVLSIAGGGFALVEASAGNTTSPATYTYRVTIDAEPGEPTRLGVPFPVAGEDDDAGKVAILSTFESKLRIVEGDGEVATPEPGWAVIEAEGPVTVEARYAFWGDIGAREAFSDWRLANATVARGPAGEANVTVDWLVDFSGGEGHTCWAHGEARATVAPGGNATLELPDSEAGDETDGVPRWSAYCA